MTATALVGFPVCFFVTADRVPAGRKEAHAKRAASLRLLGKYPWMRSLIPNIPYSEDSGQQGVRPTIINDLLSAYMQPAEEPAALESDLREITGSTFSLRFVAPARDYGPCRALQGGHAACFRVERVKKPTDNIGRDG